MYLAACVKKQFPSPSTYADYGSVIMEVLVQAGSGGRTELTYEALEQMISLGKLSRTFQLQVVLLISSSQKLILHNCVYVQVSLFLLQCWLSKSPAPMLGK